MSDFELERSPEARELAENALVRLLDALDGHELDLVVLGGLVPELLTRGQGDETPAHLGTTDIDIHITLVADPESDLSALETALEAIDAKLDPKIDGWRWLIPIEGTRVKIEFLCDLEDRPANETIPLPGCHHGSSRGVSSRRLVCRRNSTLALSGSTPPWITSSDVQAVRGARSPTIRITTIRCIWCTTVSPSPENPRHGSWRTSMACPSSIHSSRLKTTRATTNRFADVAFLLSDHAAIHYHPDVTPLLHGGAVRAFPSHPVRRPSRSSPDVRADGCGVFTAAASGEP